MRLIKRAAIISLFLFFINSIPTCPEEFLFGAGRCFGKEKDLEIYAESISYDKEKNIVEATGNVEAKYKDLKVTANHLIYNTKERSIVADRGFTLFRDGEKIEGTEINYGIDSKIGKAKKVRMAFRGVYLKGNFINMDPEKINLTDSSFSSCDLGDPHYHLSASDITLYTKAGYVVVYWGVFWIGDVPIIPVPNYVYEIGPEEAAKKQNVAPLPEVGSNDIDGMYAIERIGWYSSNKLYGDVSLIYTEKRGSGGGIGGNYIWNDSNKSNFRVSDIAKDGWFGGITHTYSFGDYMSEKIPLAGILEIRRRKDYEIELNLSSRERINYERVSKLPEVTLRSNEKPLGLPGLKYTYELSQASILEESTKIEKAKTDIKASLSHDFSLPPLGTLTSKAKLDYKWYSMEEKWLQAQGIIDIKRKWTSWIEGGIGYTHFILNEGNSPFNFEMYRFSPLDEGRANLLLNFEKSQFGINTFYDIPTWDPKDIDYFAALEIHCYNLVITYRAMRREFSFGVNLIVR